MKFGENLKSLRKSFNITQEQLAEKVNVSRQSVSKWENSEAYPEMNNILELCKIFHCKITDLITDSIIDIDSLNEEVKMNIVKFKEKKQKRVKRFCSFIHIGANIGTLLYLIVIAYEIFVFTFFGASISKASVTSNTLYEDAETSVKVVETIDKGETTLKLYNGEYDIDLKKSYNEDENRLQKYIEKHGLTFTKVRFYVGFAFHSASLVLFLFIIRCISKLFKNIKEIDTPFSVINTLLIKKIAVIYIISIGCGTISELLLNYVFPFNINAINFLTIIIGLILICLYYVFDYGHQIQLDTNSKMYGEE